MCLFSRSCICCISQTRQPRSKCCCGGWWFIGSFYCWTWLDIFFNFDSSRILQRWTASRKRKAYRENNNQILSPELLPDKNCPLSLHKGTGAAVGLCSVILCWIFFDGRAICQNRAPASPIQFLPCQRIAPYPQTFIATQSSYCAPGGVHPALSIFSTELSPVIDSSENIMNVT